MKIIGLFILVIPVLLYFTLPLLKSAEIIGILIRAIRVSFAIGAFIFVILLVLIVMEQIQDHYIDIQYQKSRGRKLLLADGNYECQYCGNQKLKEIDKTCPVCGKELK